MTVAWITGGGTGIGRALAQQLYKEGARVIITGRRKGPLDDARAHITEASGSGEIMPVCGDAADPAHAKAVISKALEQWGAINLLINNAGSNPVHNLLDTTFEEYRKLFEINCLSAINCTQAVLPFMLKESSGSIVNISSIYGRWGTSSSAAYSVAKFALAGFTESLHQAMVGTGVHVLGVYPGFIRTDMTLPYVTPGSLRSHLGKTPDQMAGAILSALRRKKTELYYPWYVPWALRLHRFFPQVADRLARRVKR